MSNLTIHVTEKHIQDSRKSRDLLTPLDFALVEAGAVDVECGMTMAEFEYGSNKHKIILPNQYVDVMAEFLVNGTMRPHVFHFDLERKEAVYQVTP